MAISAPRILIGAPASGGGKTTFTCGLLHALVRRGKATAACKCGPDYIDPMFHSEVIGAQSRNLDLFFSGEEQVRRLVADSATVNDVIVIEGVMGYYDGIAVSDEASAWHVACATDTPAVLVIDGRGRARSIAAEVAGFARFREGSRVAGVVLNRVSPMLYPRLKELVEAETGVRVYGHLPVLEDCSLESRHLGLVTASEVADLREKLDKLASVMEETVDIDGLLELAATAPDLDSPAWHEEEPVPCVRAPRIAVVHDDAFCFYYADALRLLEDLGAEGMPTVAECGGFMYLHEQLEGDDGTTLPQVGAISGTSYKTPKLGRFGYIDITAQYDGLLADAGESLPVHEFHYWDSDNPGSAFSAKKPQ